VGFRKVGFGVMTSPSRPANRKTSQHDLAPSRQTGRVRVSAWFAASAEPCLPRRTGSELLVWKAEYGPQWVGGSLGII
jgi:hypothetical protein